MHKRFTALKNFLKQSFPDRGNVQREGASLDPHAISTEFASEFNDDDIDEFFLVKPQVIQVDWTLDDQILETVSYAARSASFPFRECLLSCDYLSPLLLHEAESSLDPLGELTDAYRQFSGDVKVNFLLKIPPV